ncbi:MAG: hypothetical protein RsTaC01_0145 [Candidatus Paraimprobicoccus trichonymphae]|uniref:Uncharacterized protein n=1 Tax=Candidatus Paraimprobicoccus trichonymphae TaxID=3033793 RepID=A0AA48KZM4_9FIRM|nr:MAG: hypothetical protein RsTaC01_0145 [Candidatus Paraimprobicoccus trichonymphae]
MVKNDITSKKSAQVIIFYDLEDSRLDTLNEKTKGPINEEVEFLLGFDWNNCVNFANYCSSRNEISEFEKCDERNERVSMYRGSLERTRAYVRASCRGHNNRWDRTHCGSPGLLLESIVKAYNKGTFGDSVGFENSISCSGKLIVTTEESPLESTTITSGEKNRERGGVLLVCLAAVLATGDNTGSDSQK